MGAGFLQELGESPHFVEGADGLGREVHAHRAASLRVVDALFMQIGFLLLLGAVVGVGDIVPNQTPLAGQIACIGHGIILILNSVPDGRRFYSLRQEKI